MWHQVSVLPFLKPGKDPYNDLSYRPIALSSCPCKMMERMVNQRMNGLLPRKITVLPSESIWLPEGKVPFRCCCHNWYIHKDGICKKRTRGCSVLWFLKNLPRFIINFFSSKLMRVIEILAGVTSSKRTIVLLKWFYLLFDILWLK